MGTKHWTVMEPLCLSTCETRNEMQHFI
ncbi:hypothetical protein POUND7_015560, partial [Theobroma cacao]